MKIKIIYSITVIIVALLGFLIGLVRSESVIDYVSYFTIQSNVLVILFFSINLVYLLKSKFSIKLEIFRGAATFYILTTGTVFHFLLSSEYQPTGLDAVVNIITHYFVPVTMVFYTLFLSDNSVFKYSHFLVWLLYPYSYVIYTLIRGLFIDFYPYFFLDPNEIGYLMILVVTIILTIVFSCLGLGFIYLCKRRSRRY